MTLSARSIEYAKAHSHTAEPLQTEQARRIGTLIATGECGIAWYRIANAVWCVRSTTQCDYVGEWNTWSLPEHAERFDGMS